MSAPPAVRVVAAGRLHFGMLDLRGELGRRFGGLGATAPGCRLRLRATRARTVRATGPDADRAAELARRTLAHFGIAGGLHLHVEEALPAHAGLGSGTQLGLAVARAASTLYQVDAGIADLAAAAGRGARSGVGAWLFEGGGLVLEGGRREGSGLAPLLARLPLPAAWHAVVAIPAARAGLSGAAEADAFRRLAPPPRREVERVAHLVLMQLLPAVPEGDLESFGAALAEVQELNGGWFAGSQGGRYTPGPTARLVGALREAGGHGVGQSSWGPAVYALADGTDAAAGLAAAAREALGPEGRVVCGTFDNFGAAVTPCEVVVSAD